MIRIRDTYDDMSNPIIEIIGCLRLSYYEKFSALAVGVLTK
jgi:hypothetical protein